ncbi:DNA-directed RNA polymerase [Lentibacillus sp. JNUCC-1]|uniref:sigma-70 family RNA polymerase sigma factor n=1 Tax=Lentibacillus sp. JNUCC-1 TaxID=2654513 RepID=UPI0012E8AC63|nr:sigma-70 family RNA polymerase sigma factor [Lentibacillus sp. JNUCC-1]MUV37132.1 DNA-directed RNA polymerase [Lentibacillus sp. JNUCC-1]
MTRTFTFEEIYEQNKRRIHYQIHKLNIHDPHQEYFQEGLCAMWQAYETHNPNKGPMSTYFNYTIRNRLIDQLRKQNRDHHYQETHLQSAKLHHQQQIFSSVTPLTDLMSDDPAFCTQLKSHLTENQWKWFYHAIIQEQPYQDIAIQENTTVAAVKSWGQQARKKLYTSELKTTIMNDLSS